MKILIILLVLINGYASACTLTMGYRLNERLPLIASAPNNEGLYKDIFSLAAKQVNCELKIIREPKKRLLKKLKTGDLDFYPGFTFSIKRSRYVSFIENGLDNAFVAISNQSQPDIHSVKDLTSKVLLIAQGGPTFGAEQVGATMRYVENLTIQQAIRYILNDKADFYIYPKASIEYHLKYHPNAKIKRHQCCGIAKPMMLGFSLNSHHFHPNQMSKDDEAITPAVNSKAYKFQQAIQLLKANGTITQLYKKYYQ